MATDAETRVRLKSPVVRLAFVKLAKPDPKSNKYGVNGIFDPKTATPADMEKFKAIVEAVNKEIQQIKGFENFTVKQWLEGIRPSNFHLPFRKGGEPGVPWLARPEFAGKIVLRAESKEIPVGTVDVRGITCDPKELYSGCYAMLSGVVYRYNNESRGVNYGLNNVMKIRDGEPLGSAGVSAESDFAGIDLSEHGVDNSAEFI